MDSHMTDRTSTRSRPRTAALLLATTSLLATGAAHAQNTPTQPAAAAAPVVDKSIPKIPAGPWQGPRLPDGQPDVSGFWGPAFGSYLNLTDPEGISTGERQRNLPPREQRAPSRVSDPADGQVPYQPWARAKVQEYQAYYANPIKPEYVDPLARCAPPGIPQALYMHGHEIYQYPGYVVFLFDQGTRIIHLDNKPHLADNIKLWNGDSRGRWEGNTLVVSISNYNGKSKFGRSGEFVSENVKIEERYTFDANGKRYNYEARITDPTVLTRPFTVTVPIRKYTEADKPRPVVYAVREAKHAGKEVIIEYAEERACIEFNSGHAHLPSAAAK
ncbi:hypothetical protein [Zoogloea sp.]|uniref:hypothetical protein n=1 Tax=Zoogloea sp. TaxID=49181 RepID=UPI0035B08E1B